MSDRIDELGISKFKLVEVINKSHGLPLNTITEDEIQEVKIDLLSEGSGFMSNVYRVIVKFFDNNSIKFVIKVPRLNAFDIVNQKAQNNPQIEDRTVLDGFNIECEFYKKACQFHRVIPLPIVYYVEKLYANRQNSGLIVMEDLSERAKMVGIGNSLTIPQMFNLTKCIVKMQFYTRKTRLSEWQSKIERLPVHLQEFYLLHLPGAMIELQKIPEIQQRLPSIQAIFDRNFAFYALIDKPKKYNALAFCHGDLYSNNIFINEDHITLIDFQLTFSGSPLFDLARCLVVSLDFGVRCQIENQIFDFYYDQLSELYTKNNEQMTFTKEQAHELYILCICQQTVFIVAFVGLLMITDRKPNGDLPKCFETIKQRAIMSMKRCAQLIEEHKLIEVRHSLRQFLQ